MTALLLYHDQNHLSGIVKRKKAAFRRPVELLDPNSCGQDGVVAAIITGAARG